MKIFYIIYQIAQTLIPDDKREGEKFNNSWK
jgi:hypothetical protein